MTKKTTQEKKAVPAKKGKAAPAKKAPAKKPAAKIAKKPKAVAKKVTATKAKQTAKTAKKPAPKGKKAPAKPATPKSKATTPKKSASKSTPKAASKKQTPKRATPRQITAEATPAATTDVKMTESPVLGKRLHKDVEASAATRPLSEENKVEAEVQDKYIRYPDEICANDFVNPEADAFYRDSIDNQGAFFEREAEELHWFKKWDTAIDTSDQYMHRWFKGGETNIAYNCLDRHVKAGDGDRVCFFEDSVYTGTQKEWTYSQVLEQSGRLATVLKNQFGIGIGDRVVIYMPMIIESAFAMLSCARLGAIHSVVFGGFSAKELANRLDDCQPKLIITSSCGIEPNKVIKYSPIVEEALSLCSKLADADNLPRLIKQRLERDDLKDTTVDPTKYHDYQTLLDATSEVAECVPVPSEHPLYILYTSGTTGEPKGIVRETGGTCVGLNFCMKSVFNVNKGSVHFAGSDIGWVVGHSFIVYGPLLRGSSCVFFEGKPVVPNPGVIWDRVQKYKVTSLYMAPTGVRVIKKEDYDGEWVKKYDVSSIDGYLLVGERCDPDTINWIHRHFPNAKINDTWWQTETGWPITGNLLNIPLYGKIFPTLPGSVTRPVPGYDVRIFNDHNEELGPDQLGKVVIKMPLPPSFMLTLWGNDQAFIDKYLADTPGYYTTGDAGIKDSRGYLHIMTRMDDVINTCGHRISTGRLEEVINDHDQVVESAVIGFDEQIRGECPLAFVVLRGNGVADLSAEQQQKMKLEINNQVRKDVGAFARLIGVIFMEKLPKTRSGKILRGTIRKISNQAEWKMPATIDDVNNIRLIVDATAAWRATLK